ncbi:hypothetical protein P8452_12938 [Trifolium repens]|nr:hypothetical protein P8452_12938 [Trifolium repens]
MLLAFIYVFCLCTNAAKTVWFVSPLGIHVPENVDLKPQMLTWLTCKEQYCSSGCWLFSKTTSETSQWQLKLLPCKEVARALVDDIMKQYSKNTVTMEKSGKTIIVVGGESATGLLIICRSLTTRARTTGFMLNSPTNPDSFQIQISDPARNPIQQVNCVFSNRQQQRTHMNKQIPQN